MKPYYDHAGITIYHGDCREILPALEMRFDAVLTDPPFFMPATHYQSRVQWQRSWSDTSVLATFWAVIVDACVRVLKPTGHFVTFCNGDSYPVFYPEMYRRFDVLKCLVWDKGQIGMGNGWRNQHELAIAARWSTSEFSGWSPDVIRATPSRSSNRDHPVQKPDGLIAALMQPTTPVAGAVLDPFMGGGSTLTAAARIGRSCVGIEAEERYCDIAARRLAQEVLPLEASA